MTGILYEMYLLLQSLPLDWNDYIDSYEPGPGVLMRLFKTKMIIMIIIIIKINININKYGSTAIVVGFAPHSVLG